MGEREQAPSHQRLLSGNRGLASISLYVKYSSLASLTPLCQFCRFVSLAAIPSNLTLLFPNQAGQIHLR
jgi:hypothetical protein